ASQLLEANKSASVSRVDIAVDFETQSEDAARVLLKLLDQHLVLKWRSPRATKVRLETRGRATVYWSQGRTNRQLTVYTKKADEIIRVELRFLGSSAVRRAGLADPASLRELNPRKILDHNIAFVS